MENMIFFVNDEPYCLWDIDLKQRNLNFLRGVDPDYFEYLLNAFIESDDESRSSLAIRSALHHALETFFSFVGAYIQAPGCAYAWLAKCKNITLRNLVRRISKGDIGIKTIIQPPSMSWLSIAQIVFASYFPGTSKQETTARLFADTWSRLASDFCKKEYIDEYNALKHGLRLRRGGFSLAVGLEEEYGQPPPNMKLLSKSEFGATFVAIEKISERDGNRSVRPRNTSVNWSSEKDALLLQLVHMSLVNVISALRIANQIPPSECPFIRPENDCDFIRPWEKSAGITSMSMDYTIDSSNTSHATKEQLILAFDGSSKNG